MIRSDEPGQLDLGEITLLYKSSTGLTLRWSEIGSGKTPSYEL